MIYYNANEFGYDIEDCTIRSLSVAEGISWDEAYRKLSDYAMAAQSNIFFSSRPGNAIISTKMAMKRNTKMDRPIIRPPRQPLPSHGEPVHEVLNPSI